MLPNFNSNYLNLPISFDTLYKFDSSTFHQSNSYTYTHLLLPFSFNDSFSSLISTSLINDVYRNRNSKNEKSIDITSINNYNDDNITTEINDTLPLFVKKGNLIKVPSKVYRTLQRDTPRHLLKAIHKDIDVAIELCLIFTTQITSTYFDIKEGGDGWKSLKAEYLRELLSTNPMTYKYVITAMEYPLEKGQIIHCDHKSQEGEKCFYYRLGQDFLGKGIVSHELKTKVALEVIKRHRERKLSKDIVNPIKLNLIKFYGSITLPTEKQIIKEAKRLIKLGYRTKKGKILTYLNKHSREYYGDASGRSFVEDAIEIFRYLTNNGLMIPDVGDERSGGRVVDSFTLMPSWIRRMVKIDGRRAIEADYTCLHPNIAISLYGGGKEYLEHGDLQLVLDIDVDIVKVEHLSFFNKKMWQMKLSPLYKYYQEHEQVMLEKIIREKYISPFGHKVTSRRLFKKEVEIMTDVIEILKKEGIYVGYIYDALFCHPRYEKRVKEVMDQTILKHGVKTTAKIFNRRKYNPYSIRANESKYTLESLLKETVSVNPLEQSKGVDVCQYKVVAADDLNFGNNIKDKILERINSGEAVEFIDVVIKFPDGETFIDKVTDANDYINPKQKYITPSFINQMPFTSRIA